MKILIMSVTAGEGHNSTAKAMKAYIESRDVKCDILDTFAYISKELAKMINDTYLFISGPVKPVFKIGYRLAEKRRYNANGKSPARFLNRAFTRDIYKYIKQYDPDAIIYTHPFAGLILDLLKVKGKISCKTVGILTDFRFHPYWEECLHSDYIITPSEALSYQAKEKGFSESQIVPLGIPINPKFSASLSREEAASRLGLDPKLPTILIMGGSMGYGHMAKTIADIDNIDLPGGFQMISVCGNNKTMKKKIDSMTFKHTVLNNGFVNNIEVMMDAADCIISKPGGLTTSEALAKRLPMIIVNPIPGQEVRNTEFLLNHGAAMSADITAPVSEVVYQFMTHPHRAELMKQAIDEIRHPDSTREVCDFVIGLADENNSDPKEILQNV